MRPSLPSITGQWLGEFTYGPDYGDIAGEKVSFSLVLEAGVDGQFHGKCYELEGAYLNDTVAHILGYVEGDFIHFVKEYPVSYVIEDDGSLTRSAYRSVLTYDAQYHHQRKGYFGTWELEVTLGPSIEGDVLHIQTGTWEMTRVSLG